MTYGLYILSILVENLKIMQPMISIMHVKDTQSLLHEILVQWYNDYIID
jgi:hypothetical protein